MKNRKTKNGGDGRKNRLKQLELFEKLKESQIKSREYPSHPEADHLRKHTWEGMLTIRFESGSFSGESSDCDINRDLLVRRLMKNIICRKWREYPRNVYWVACTEFGESGVGHCHILFNFGGLKYRGRDLPDLTNLLEEARESLDFVCSTVDCDKSSVDLQWEPKFDDLGLVNYFSKVEPGRESYKHFTYSTSIHRYCELLNQERQDAMDEFLQELMSRKKISSHK